MAFYNVCPHCGAHLDPGEQCDCAREREALEENTSERRDEKWAS